MTINKRRPELFALSDRNTPQRFGAPWHRPVDKASLSHSERGPAGEGCEWKGGSGELGVEEIGGGGGEAARGAKSLRAVQVN